MIIKKMSKLIKLILILNIIIISDVFGADQSFNIWLKDFKKRATDEGISKKVVDEVMSKAIFLPNVIKYDRYQPEFYEDTYTYVKKELQEKKLKTV